MKARITVLPGDGVGPEVTAEAVNILEAVGQIYGHKFQFDQALLGGCAIDQTGQPLPLETLGLCQAGDAVLLGAVGGPRWSDPTAAVRPEQGLLGLRKQLGLFANLRPVKLTPSLLHCSTIKPEVLAGVDLLVVRELTGGIYFGPRLESEAVTGRGEAFDTMLYHRQEIERVARVAAEAAQARRRSLASVDKANVLASSRLWRQVVTGVIESEYPELSLEHVLVDAMAMHLIRRPAAFDVVLAGNLFGDIITDEASMLAGSLGLLPSASVGKDLNRLDLPRGLYEPIHGSAPDIAGQGIANPLAAILSAAMLLRHSLGLDAEAGAVEAAVAAVLDQGLRTIDIGELNASVVGSAAMGEAVCNAVTEGRRGH
ncbi:MAG: 3-isopropylmalate dehydrogenase [Chloroflexota bacterium]|nr:3-isopropylmalate dehydrogenase [Chloroflexota bacterium]